MVERVQVHHPANARVDSSQASYVHGWVFGTRSINVHMGTPFGLVNQILLALLAVGLICVTVWGYRMWWQRRPTRSDRRVALGTPPARGGWRNLPSGALAVGIVVVAVVRWVIPLFGIPLAVFLAVDLTVGVVRNRSTAGSAAAS
ncbi:PepSY domain-containing protein [Streptomyces sp. NPDC101225]|uniref:PepSY domain-containing protein n=1 Tax=Streptomyces sp. NPDC101225 TaxID=3366135 RepID=UPI0038145A9F